MFSLHLCPPKQQLFLYVAPIMNVVLCFQDKNLQSINNDATILKYLHIDNSAAKVHYGGYIPNRATSSLEVIISCCLDLNICWNVSWELNLGSAS